MFVVRKFHRQAQDNPHAIREYAYHIRFSANVRATSVAHIRWALIFIRQVKGSKIWEIYGKCSTGSARICSPSCAAGIIISTRQSSNTLWGKFPIVAQLDVPRRIYEMPLA